MGMAPYLLMNSGEAKSMTCAARREPAIDTWRSVSALSKGPSAALQSGTGSESGTSPAT
jgi:hypothetical protein